MKKCKWCCEKIKDKASACPNCQLSQSKFLRYFSVYAGAIAVAISILSLLLSILAFWYSNRSPEPQINTHVLAYDGDSLQFQVYNYGNSPTVITDTSIYISLSQADTLHITEVFFKLSKPILLKAGESEIIEILYDSYLPVFSNWKTSGGKDKFDLGFLSASAALGSNLHCELKVSFSAEGYYKYWNTSSTATNGNCVPAMSWFSSEIGPLKVEK